MVLPAGLSVLLLLFLQAEAGGAERSSGYCIGNACFILFRDPSTFSSARERCRALGSHLMTVRTSVANDVLSVLLGNFSGSFWIGLHRLSGCPDPSKELRGFHWVTKDTESDFTNWLPGSDSSCLAARCVSVSREQRFRWSQAPCAQQAEGFLCENSFTEPCTSLPHEPQESVRYRTPDGFKVEEILSPTLPPGSIAVRLPSESKYICSGQQWLPAPWSCEIKEGGCEHKCAVDQNNAPICYCPPQLIVDPINRVTCQAWDEDHPCAALRCQQTCLQNGTQHVCGCGHGLQLAADGRSCVDFDECADERQCPGENFKCLNSPMGYKCVCEQGYTLMADQCVDVDECVSAPCEQNCVNTPGGYFCSCFEGYIEDENKPERCRLHCGEEECPAMCDPNNQFQCFCPDGFLLEERANGFFCLDMDECDFNFCSQSCKNTYGGYVCSCAPGFTLIDRHQCVIIDDEVTDGSPTTSTQTPPTTPHPEPTRRPSRVSAGGLVGIIVGIVFLIVLAVFAAQLVLIRRGKEGAAAGGLKEEETHSLHGLSDTHGEKVV
ncbi:PREDICTED: thrombomodulin-like [Cyprinodon variegatus]|uniref:thrombomodulin-like n=1 Tax=Cyprinodon variegatus TaxID=28743 RepID=UPI0007426A28|nr:PREDICTED: thrombomodulin-like [Cyprinodon variegatus]